MTRYDPERMELSTRDRVALAAYTEIKEGRGTPDGGVWLDVSHLPRETIMRAAAARLPDPAGPADARHHDDARSRSRRRRTTRWAGSGCATKTTAPASKGLYAIGEASSGLHGANRLGGNSLDRTARLRADRRSSGGAPTRRGSMPSSVLRPRFPRPATEIDELLAVDGPENVRFLAARAAQRDDRARRCRARRGRATQRASLSWTPIEERHGPCSACTPTSPASTTSRTHSTSRPAPSRRGPHSRPRWNGVRPAAVTTAPTIPISTMHSMSTWSGRGPAGSSAKPSRAIPEEIATRMREVSAEGKLVE